MKYASLRILAAGLLLSGASLILAQSPEPPNILRIYREDIKSGRSSAHERVESGYARAFAKTAYPSYVALDGLSGTSQVWFLEMNDSYAAMEKAIQLSETEPLKSTLAQLSAQDGDLRTGERGMIATYQKDLSYLPVPSNLAKARFFTINTVRIRPGHAADFAEMRKLLNAAFAKNGSQQRRVVYSVVSGMPNGTYLILSAMDSLKTMDPLPTAMPMAQAFGPDNQARYNKLTADIVISAEQTLFAISPKMSNPTKEMIAADPDFWAPKPKPVAAKPAGSQ